MYVLVPKDNIVKKINYDMAYEIVNYHVAQKILRSILEQGTMLEKLFILVQ